MMLVMILLESIDRHFLVLLAMPSTVISLDSAPTLLTHMLMIFNLPLTRSTLAVPAYSLVISLRNSVTLVASPLSASIWQSLKSHATHIINS